jgi:Zn-dependent protease with chaperone function
VPLSNSFRAHFYDGQGAQREAVSVTLTQAGLTLTRANGLLHHWRFGEISRPKASVSGGPLRLEHGPAPRKEVLLFPDESILNAVTLISPSTRLGKRTKGPIAIAKTLVILAVAAAALVAALNLYIIPATGRMLAQRMSPAVEDKLGKAVVNQMAPRDEQCTDIGVAAPAGFVLDYLSRQVEDNKYQFKVYISNREDVNALAAPGGSIIVFGGLLATTRSPGDLAAVLAHEMIHITEKHATRAVMRSLTLGTMLSFLFDDIDGGLVQLASRLGELRYLRQDEEAADLGAMRLLERARIDPRAMTAVYRTLQQNSAYFSSHPFVGDRLHAAEEWAAKASYLPVPILSAQPWPPKPKSPTACLPPR